MGESPFSPFAPARVRVLVLPVGRIKGRRFQSFVKRLQAVKSVRLGDLPADADAGAFSPDSFPDGHIFLDIAATAPPRNYADLAPLELFRNILIVIGTVDGQEYHDSTRSQEELVDDGSRNIFYQRAHDGFVGTMENITEQYPTVLTTRLAVMDVEPGTTSPWIPADALCVSGVSKPDDDSVAGLFRSIIGVFLKDVNTYAETVKTWTNVPTPLSAHARPARLDSSRRPDHLRSVSNRSQQSDDASPTTDNTYRNESRSASQAFESPPVSAANSPRPDSRNEDQRAMETRPETVTTSSSSSMSGLWKVRSSKYASMSGDVASKNLYATAGAQANAERDRNVARARANLLIASLYLLTGKWPNAWLELNESVGKLRSLSDCVWLSVGLERVLVCMTLLGTHNFSFQIPSVCFLQTERQSTLSFLDGNKDSPVTAKASDPDGAKTSLSSVGAAMAELISTIFNYYDRAGSMTGECLPQLSFSEMVLRLVALQIFASGSSIDHAISREVTVNSALHCLVVSQPAAGMQHMSIAETALRAYPGSFADIPIPNRLIIFAEIANDLGLLGLKRKRAMILKECLTLLLPVMAEARRAEAAEIGIHPSSGASHVSVLALHDLSSVSSTSAKELLSQLFDTYNISTAASDPVDDFGDEPSEDEFTHAITNITDSAHAFSSLDDLGSLQLKFDMLRASIYFCELLPDLSAVAAYSSLLLKTAGPQCPVNPAKTGSFVRLAAEEQVRLLNNIMDVNSTAVETRLSVREPPYWDDFLVRDVVLVSDDVAGKLTATSRAQVDAAKKGPFLHDAFGKTTSKEEKLVVVTGEPSLFSLVLQNPFEFDVEVERIELVTDIGTFHMAADEMVLLATSIQDLNCTVVFRKAGTMTVWGCRVKVAGCEAQFHPIFPQSWQRDDTTMARDPAGEERAQQRPIAKQLRLDAITGQPRMIVESTTLQDGSVYLLEGQKSTFEIVLHNTSPEAGVNICQVTFEDNLSKSSRASAMASDISRAALYELEVQLRDNPVFTIQRTDGEGEMILAGARATFKVTVYGRMCIQEAAVIFDYGQIERDAETGNIYTRSLTVPVNISTSPTIQISGFDIIRLTGGSRNSAGSQQSYGSDDCLMVMDLRNASNSLLEMTLTLAHGQDLQREDFTVSLDSGQSRRIAAAIKRCHIKNALSQIPWLSAQSKRQFVVSTADSVEQDLHSREIFWYREQLLSGLSAQWRDVTNNMHGAINLRSIALSARALEAFRLPEVEIGFKLSKMAGDNSKVENDDSFSTGVGQLSSLRVTVLNRSDKTVTAMLRLQPALAGQAQDMLAMDAISRRFLWSGLLQLPLEPLASGQERTVDVGFCVLAAGTYEIGAVVEEICPAVSAKVEQEGERHAVEEDDDGLAAKVKAKGEVRRIWRALEPCLVHAYI